MGSLASLALDWSTSLGTRPSSYHITVDVYYVMILLQTSPQVSEYDIIAVQPISERTFQVIIMM